MYDRVGCRQYIEEYHTVCCHLINDKTEQDDIDVRYSTCRLSPKYDRVGCQKPTRACVVLLLKYADYK